MIPSLTSMHAYVSSYPQKVAEQVYEPIIRVSTRKPQVPPAPHSNKNHTTKNNNESATDAAATDSGSHHSSSSIHGGKGAGVEASMSLASVSYALVDLHASYATEVFLHWIHLSVIAAYWFFVCFLLILQHV
jgi:hypothetical protein